MVNRVNVFTGIKYKGGWVCGGGRGGAVQASHDPHAEPRQRLINWHQIQGWVHGWVCGGRGAREEMAGKPYKCHILILHTAKYIPCVGRSSSEDGRQWVDMPRAVEPEGFEPEESLWLVKLRSCVSSLAWL